MPEASRKELPQRCHPKERKNLLKKADVTCGGP